MVFSRFLSVIFLSFFLFFSFLPQFSIAESPDDPSLDEIAEEEEIAEDLEAVEPSEEAAEDLAAEQNPPNSDSDEEDVRVVQIQPSAPEKIPPVLAEPEALKPQARWSYEKPWINRNAPPPAPRWEQELDLASAKASAQVSAAAMGCSLQR